jgi:hypothetical protein
MKYTSPIYSSHQLLYGFDPSGLGLEICDLKERQGTLLINCWSATSKYRGVFAKTSTIK